MCSKSAHNRINSRERRHYFFLSPYENEAFTRCPECNGKTRLRKYPLVVHVEPAQVLCINKKCKFCETCDLIITKQIELESWMALCCEKINPDLIGNDYEVIGTMDTKEWKEIRARVAYPDEIVELVYFFINYKQFDIVPAGWRKES